MLRSLAFFLAASITCALTAPAQAFPVRHTPQPVVEFYNVDTNHYFLTIDFREMEAIDAGSAGPGWIRTGFSFQAYHSPTPPGMYCPADCGVPVHRFYSFESNSHFFTASGPEADGLRAHRARGGEWHYEQVGFSVAVPDAQGQCAPGLVPVQRLYNDRFAFRDSNHRFVTEPAQRDRMVGKGWHAEGAVFCAYGAGEVPIRSFEVAISLRDKILPSAQCEDESINLGPCLALNQLPVPRTELGPYFPEASPSVFSERTGLSTPFVYVVGNASPEAAAQNVFVQGDGLGAPLNARITTSVLGIHVDTRDRAAGFTLSSVNPLYQLKTTTAPGTFDKRFFPFGPAEDAVEIRVSYDLHVKTLRTRGDQSHAYGHPTLEFTDTLSGRNVYFVAGTYGTVPFGETYLAVDPGTGKVIVGPTLGRSSPYLRNFGLAAIPLPHDFVSPNPIGTGGTFDFRVDRAEFARVLAAARTIQPELSANPADYLLDNFHFNNEVYLDGAIGLRLSRYRLELVRKQSE